MDRLSHLRGEAGGSRDSTLDTTSPPSESFMTANESSSKYFSLSEVDSVDSSFDISSIKDVSLASTATDTEGTITNADELMSNLSPIGKKSDMLDSYKIGKQIEAANILSGGVDIFDDNDNSYDGDELVIDDNVDVDDKSNSDMKQPEEMQFKSDENMIESTLINEEMDIASKDTEVVLQIDGKNVDAIDIGNGLYLYRKEGQEELAAVQIIDDDQQQTSFKFLKVRENAEGNLEVYEEIEIEVPKEVPAKEGKMPEKKTSSHVPITDINKVISESGCNKVAERKTKVPRKEPILTKTEVEVDSNKESPSDAKTEVNINGKMMKFSESRKSPVIGSYTAMTYHSTPNKERIPLTKTMVDQQLHPNRHSDNVKKTIEVHTDSSKQRTAETPTKNKDISDDIKNVDASDNNKSVEVNDDNKIIEEVISDKELVIDESVETVDIPKEADKESTGVKNEDKDKPKDLVPNTDEVLNEKCDDIIELPVEQENVVDSTDKDMTSDKAIIKESVEDVIVCEEDKEEKSSEKNVNVIEKTEEDVEIVEVAVSATNKVEEKIEEPVQSDSVEIQKVNDVTTTNQVEEKQSEPVKISTDEGVKEVDVTNNKNKETVVDNTQCDNQDKTKAEEIIYDITDQDNDDIIIIDDSEIDDSKIEDKTSSEVKVEVQKQSNVESDISKKNEAVSKVNECPEDKNKKETSVTPAAMLVTHEAPTKTDNTPIKKDEISTKTDEKPTTTDETPTKKDEITTKTDEVPTKIDEISTKIDVAPTKKDEISTKIDDAPTKKVEISTKIDDAPTKTDKTPTKIKESPVSNEIAKISQSKIPVPILKSESVTLQPIKSDTSTKDLAVPIVVNEHKIELKPETLKETGPIEKDTKEVVKHIPVAEVPTQPYSKLEKPQKVETKIDKNQDKLIYVPEALTTKTTTLISSMTSKTEVKPKKENNVFDKSPKKLSKPFAESQSSIMPLKIDSIANIKVDTTKKPEEKSNKVPSREVKEQKPIVEETSQRISEVNSQTKSRDADVKIAPKDPIPEKQNIVKEVKSSVPKEEQPSCSGIQDVSSTSTDSLPSQSSDNRNETGEARDESNTDEPGGSKEAVPFGKWTATNRKEFLIKMRNRTTVAPAVPSTSSNQLKNTNDLNRRDVLQKIDSQRQQSSSAAALAKSQEANKNVKNETAFVSKTNLIQKKDNVQEAKVLPKPDIVKETPEAVVEKAPVKQDVPNNVQNEVTQVASATSVKKDSAQRTEVNYQDLIDKTIEDMIHRTVAPTKPQDEPGSTTAKESNISQSGKFPPNCKPTDQATLDEIEMKMNELHGIPFIERPAHELPVVPVAEAKPKTYSKIDKEKATIHNKTSKIPNLLPFANKNPVKISKDSVIEVDSEDEVIEHEPITGDIAVTKKTVTAKLPPKEKAKSYASIEKPKQDAGKKEPIITEKDFDKFARRNSKTYENCLTMNLDSKDTRNVIQTVVEKDQYPKSYSKNDIARVDPKAKPPYKYQNVRPIQPAKVHGPKVGSTANEDSSNRNQSKLQKAYHSALSAKRQLEGPITIIEDKPVKVVFMDNMEFVPSPLNLQGQQLSPAKKLVTESDNFTVSTLDSLESETVDTTEDTKAQEEIKTKSKHQRKQVLTPVDEPELELIEPKDLGLEASPKKKRKTEEDKTDKTVKYPMRKKYYLLGSNTVADDKYTPTTDVIKNPLKETVNLNDNGVSHKNAVSAIDNLVKAAELLEHQSENRNIIDSPNTDSQQSTPVKRGRGRPRKYPLPEGGVEKNKAPSPQKKPRLIDAKVPKRDPVTTTDDDDDDSDDEIIKENWTMGKINENIVCPICNKLFRTENVVFKHVKHCTGPSPSRSGSDKRSPRRMRPSQESDSKSQSSKSDDMDLDDDKPLVVVKKETPKKRKSKDSIAKSDDKDEVIVIEDTPPAKEKSERKEKETDDRKIHESRKPRAKIFNKGNDLVCEFCGKTFRQLSYLVSHKLQHKKEESKKVEKEAPAAIKSVYSCEVCKKEFRKLHHLVQHRIIHNPSSAQPARTQRKSSSEQSDTKIEKEPNSSKHSEDASAGFRCEPCDKSFRKLHHLVEHRETHDGINRQKTTPAVVQNNVEKPVTLHQCEVCKKTFRKLHHLIEHKEQHVETSSEKSDDKSVKSSLSTKDIIHECSLCYMVFPNEHSLNKHTIICQRKKRQSKQAKPVEGSEAGESIEDSSESAKVEEKSENVDTPKVIEEKVKEDTHKKEVEKVELPVEKPKPIEDKPAEVVKEVQREIETVPLKVEAKPVEPQVATPTKRDFSETVMVKTEEKPEVPEKIKKVDVSETKGQETPKKKSPKEKTTPNANKRPKTTAPAPDVSSEDNKPAVESSDDDEVRYMLNPNFQVEDVTEEKVFMKVRANKRSSLQIERPNSKDLVKRRTSLQHPPKIPRLKPKPVEPASVKIVAKTPKVEPMPSTDSDDSETVKYSFPKTIPEKPTKSAQDRTPQKKTLADKRKSLSGIAKRKSLGKVVTARHKPLPVKQIKRRTQEVEHRCDCGQLFSSAALLSRHTTLAHTPPRIRRRRSPSPEVKPTIKPAPRKSSVADKPKQAPASRKSSTRSDSSTSTNAKLNKQETKPTRKSLDKDTKTPAEARKPKPEKSEAKSSVKPRRTGAHRGVPVPEKMRKLMQKNNK
ncbi:titin [Spodoptera frugiperda]|uniref:Titin n=1 Tax=Spodoptera frugiperda TaxID=7108 RepID=A0A9R0F4H9_SPOFR|nr:titin [Spodoptera frugiperda]XP_050562505.1 titin [Spodoptera frugiperda]XP_050562506.1 titin [Spodoptera frugiperda]XP_050562507.1 titin [Spodoptera frugiperda]